MKERGMIFNGEMVRAILDGRKTQTRRPVKFPVHDKNLGCELSGNELAGELSAGNYLNSAFGKPGDRIWVREAYRFPASLDDVSPTGVGEMAVATGYRKPWAPTFYEFTGTFSDGWKGFETLQKFLTPESFAHQSTCLAGPVAFCWKSPTCGLNGLTLSAKRMRRRKESTWRHFMTRRTVTTALQTTI